MKVFKIELMVIDFDEVGQDGIQELLENHKYPNWCMSPDVMDIQVREVEWSDDHPLNKFSEQKEAFEKLFAPQVNLERRAVPHAETTEKVILKLKEMSVEEVRQTFVESGILNEDGSLAKEYK